MNNAVVDGMELMWRLVERSVRFVYSNSLNVHKIEYAVQDTLLHLNALNRIGFVLADTNRIIEDINKEPVNILEDNR